MAKKTKTVVDKNEEQQKMLQELCDTLNKLNKSGDGKVTVGLGSEDSTSNVTDWVSSGCTMLDIAISNRPNGGIPVGRIVEIVGLEGSGKSLISAHTIASIQKMGGHVLYIDTEAAINRDFWAAIGVEPSKVVVTDNIYNVEDIFQTIENAIVAHRKWEKNLPFLIVVDSVAAASTKTEIGSGYDKEGYNTTKAIVVSKAMRKITNMIGKQKVLLMFTNQFRYNMNAVAFGEKYVVPGGKAIAYHSSVRIKLDTVAKLKKGTDIVGNKCKATVFKNRMGPPHKSVEFEIYYDSGISDYASWISVLKTKGIVSQAGKYYKYKSDKGEDVQFESKTFPKFLRENPELKEELYNKICDACILKYKSPNEHSVEDDLESEENDSGTQLEIPDNR